MISRNAAPAIRLFALAALLTNSGCSPRNFALTDEAATSRLMATNYVRDLGKEIRAPLVCFVERSTSNERFLYLGENHPDHTARLRACRVTSDGRVWVNADDTLLEDRWVEIR